MENPPKTPRRKPPAIHLGKRLFSEFEKLVNPEENERTRFNDLGKFVYFLGREYFFDEAPSFNPKTEKHLLITRTNVQEQLEYNEERYNEKLKPRIKGGENSAGITKNLGNANAVKPFEVGTSEEDRLASAFLDKLRNVFAKVNRGGLAGREAFRFVYNNRLWENEAEILARAEKWVRCRKWNTLGSKGGNLAPSVRQWLVSGDYLREPSDAENAPEVLLSEQAETERVKEITRITNEREIPPEEAELWVMLKEARNALPNGTLEQLRRYVRQTFERRGKGVTEAKNLSFKCIALTDKLSEELKIEEQRRFDREQLGFNISAIEQSEGVSRERAEFRAYYLHAVNTRNDVPFFDYRSEVTLAIAENRKRLTNCTSEQAQAFAERAIQEPLNASEIEEQERLERERERLEREAREAREGYMRRNSENFGGFGGEPLTPTVSEPEQVAPEVKPEEVTPEEVKTEEQEQTEPAEIETAQGEEGSNVKALALELKCKLAPLLKIPLTALVHNPSFYPLSFDASELEELRETFLTQAKLYAETEEGVRFRERVGTLNPATLNDVLKTLLAFNSEQEHASEPKTPETAQEHINAILSAFKERNVKAFANKRSQALFKKNRLSERFAETLKSVDAFLATPKGAGLSGSRFEVSEFFEWVTTLEA